jgi:3-hydroxyacyl-CoA dehydrogenase/enoyl-CoA hydratase/3-hydroxybutyryl-CoA epimerase
METTWIATPGTDGILRVRIDQPGRSVNALSRGALEELDQLLARIEPDRSIRGVLFRSAKSGTFIAGADIEEMKHIAGPDTARELSQFGQRVFERLSRLDVPTIALISGSCLGGGLEFAMACRYRIADDQRKTLLGLPEVKLGLVPGWGGTVRLPRLVGMPAALRIITSGEMVNGRQAKRMGLVHDVVPSEALEIAAERFFERPPQPRRRSWTERWVVGSRLGQRLALRQARKLVWAKSHGHYPAPIQAIDVLEAGLSGGPQAGFTAESAAIAELAAHPVTVECLRLFFLREESKRWAAAATPADVAQTVASAAVLGAGAMGAGIARIMADRGITVRLKDVSPEFLSRGLRAAKKLCDDDARKGRTTARHAAEAMARISPTTDYTGLHHCEIAIEAVIEDLGVKHAVFRDLERVCGPQTVLATNTSSLRVADIASAVSRPERVVGLHFFNPPHQMPLVEVVRTEGTSPQTLAMALSLVNQLGKTPVVVRDCAGFLVNRLLMPYMNEVGYLLGEVADPMEIERAAVQFGFPMGPLELTDLVGADVSTKVAEFLHQAYGPRMEPAPAWRRLKELKGQLKSGQTPKLIVRSWLGRKRINPVVRRLLSALRREHAATARTTTPTRSEIVERIVYPVINEACRCLAEGIVAQAEQIDLAMVFGTGFAPFRGGPLRYADLVGAAKIVETLDRLAALYPRLAPCDYLREIAASGRRFQADPVPPALAAAG